MNRVYDVAVVGAGLAGLSLAVRLAARPDPPQILLIDPRTTYENDRTWCSWSMQPHPFGDCVSHRWSEWSVGSGKTSVTRRCERFPYQRIPADALYGKAQALLAQAPTVTWALGRSVLAMTEKPASVQIDLAAGNSVEARLVYDSRPAEIKTDDGWRQIFYGLEIRCPGASWDPGKVGLMDFQQANADGLRFFYILPLSQDTFLVEDTWLCPPGRIPQFCDADILAYAAERIGGMDYEILHREKGSIPMFAQPKRAGGGRILAIGTRGGAVRSSSGYAFTRIQQEADALAEAYPNLPTNRKGGIFLQIADAIFLKAIANHPEDVPAYMQRLFARVEPERLIRFMESCPSWRDGWSVIRALPPWPFVKAAGSAFL